VVLVGWALTFAYFFICEAVWGQTVGKRRYGLRVVAVGGGSAGLSGIAARNALRFLDASVFYLLGLLVALITGPDRRRIGDWAGGTVVVRDDAAPADRPPRATLALAGYPALALAAAVLAAVAIGGDSGWTTRQNAAALVRAYIAARDGGHAAAACALLSVGQQRELSAIQSNDYPDASASMCPRYILQSDPNSHLLSPRLAGLTTGTLTTNLGPGGSVFISSTDDPQFGVIAAPQNGQLRLDTRGEQRVGFTAACATASKRLSNAGCACVFDSLRAQDELPDDGVSSDYYLATLGQDAQRCAPTTAQIAT